MTDNDVTRRVISKSLSVDETEVNEVMSKNPKCVNEDDSALDALDTMVQNRFRHLPVLDRKGSVVGVLDIAKCLYDTISVLQKVEGDDNSASSNSIISAEATEAIWIYNNLPLSQFIYKIL